MLKKLFDRLLCRFRSKTKQLTQLKSSLKWELVLNYALPFRCLSCDELTLNNNSFCPKCWFNLNFITYPFCNVCGRSLPFIVTQNSACLKCIQKPPAYDLARAMLKFDEQSKKLIHHFKYYDKTSLAKAFAKHLCSIYKNEIKDFDLIIPVPMYKLKRMLRFYNQAFVLAKEVSLISKLTVHADVLLKTKWTKPQATLSKKERDKNLKNSFIIKNPQIIQNKKIILIDDVATTGTTIETCAKELKKYASQVLVLCIAFT